MYSFSSKKHDIEMRRKLLRFINEQSRAAATCCDEDREESRSKLNFGVFVVPLNADGLDILAAQPAIARDLTSNGIGIIVQDSMDTEKAIVILPGDDEPLFAQIEVRHSRSLGIGFFLLGGTIVKLVTSNDFPILKQFSQVMRQPAANAVNA